MTHQSDLARAYPHAEVQLLLPWYATGRLDPAERGRVNAHLAACPDCRAEAEAAQDEARTVAATWPDTDRGWARLQAQVTSTPSAFRVVPLRLRWRLAAPALLAAGLALGVLVAPALPQLMAGPASDQPAYRGLGASQMPGNALLILYPDASEADLRAAVRRVGASVVGGPTPANAWVLHVPRDRFEQRMAELAASQQVRLAHPLVETAP